MSRAIVTISWDDCGHLDEQQKAAIYASIPPYQRDARSKGRPYLGAGAIYKIPEDDLRVRPFPIPGHWWQGYGLDVGWNRTAAAFMAYDPDGETWYLFDEYYRAEAEPSVHAAAIVARGRWMTGEIDPASRGRSQADGEQLIKLYRKEGLQLYEAVNAVEAGILQVWRLMTTGRFKVFDTCQNFLREVSVYRRNDKGQIVKENDHLCDAVRYRCMGPVDHLRVPPSPEDELAKQTRRRGFFSRGPQGWMR